MDILSGFQVVLEGLLFSGILVISGCLGQGHLSGDVYGYPPHLSNGLFQAFMHQRGTFCGGTNIHLLATKWTVEVEM